MYRGPEGETTEWGDIQRRIGNFAPLPEVFKPDPWTPGEEEEGVNGGAASGGGAEAGQERMNHKSARELEEMEDEFADDGFLEEYRCVRVSVCDVGCQAVVGCRLSLRAPTNPPPPAPKANNINHHPACLSKTKKCCYLYYPLC